jgi:Sec-independent protein translocase protein TatA
MLVVWIVAGLIAIAVLAGVLFGVVGSLRRLSRELTAFERELRPLAEQAQQTAARAAAMRERASSTG